MKPETNDPRPAYLQVADDLRTSITDRTFKPGERLPSGRELARRYGVAPMTISHALDVLRSEQLVEAYQGRGVFVADHPVPPIASRDDGRQDPAVASLRNDLDQLAERVAQIERILANRSDTGHSQSEARDRLGRVAGMRPGGDERTVEDEARKANKL